MARVLVVDDDRDMVEACQLVLERGGFQVSAAYSREDGMAAIERSAPDVLILDVMMVQPDDGIAMAQELRRKGFKFPILMLTSIGKATGLTYDKDESLVPVDDFHEKPIDADVLVAKVRTLLQHKK